MPLLFSAAQQSRLFFFFLTLHFTVIQHAPAARGAFVCTHVNDLAKSGAPIQYATDIELWWWENLLHAPPVVFDRTDLNKLYNN